MQLTQPISAGASRPLGHAFTSVEERVVESKVRARRRRVIRTVLLLFTTSAILCGFVTWRRDSMTIDSWLQTVNGPMVALQKKIDQLGRLPAAQPEFEGAIESYANAADRFYAMQSSKPVIVAISPSVPLILRENGRCVIMYDRGKVYSDFMPRRQFEAAV